MWQSEVQTCERGAYIWCPRCSAPPPPNCTQCPLSRLTPYDPTIGRSLLIPPSSHHFKWSRLKILQNRFLLDFFTLVTNHFEKLWRNAKENSWQPAAATTLSGLLYIHQLLHLKPHCIVRMQIIQGYIEDLNKLYLVIILLNEMARPLTDLHRHFRSQSAFRDDKR